MSTRSKATLLAALATAVVLSIGAYEFHSMRVNTHLPLWAIGLITLPRLMLVGIIWLLWRLTIRLSDTREVAPGCFSGAFFVFFLLFSMYLGHRGADHFFLRYLCGPNRVQTEHLHMVRMGQHNPWPVTVYSGDRELEHVPDYQVWQYIDGAIQSAVFFPALLVIVFFRARKSSRPFIFSIRFWKMN